MDTYVAAEKLGIRLKKQWLATLDGRTRHSHAALDGRSAENDEPFPNGCMFPGDPSGRPEETYNCRCTLIADIEDSPYENAKRRDGATDEVVDDVTYEEWEKQKSGVFRRLANAGVFAELPERMSKKHIREVARSVGFDLRGLTVNIDRNEELLRFALAGEAVPEHIGQVTFFPNAFRSREELIRTMFHESVHVCQFREYGVEYVQNNLDIFEELAYSEENKYINDLRKKGLL